MHTHVTNHLSVPIHATTSYLGGHSKFKARNILPGGSDVDEYNWAAWGIDIGIKAPNDGAKCCGHIVGGISVSVWPRVVNGVAVEGFIVTQDGGNTVVCTADGYSDSCTWDVE
ncbi:hypothetical protein WJX74_009190 [Apatococcus lobatus]|uniref:Uncharacterized protein n=1 Tax=Apatococcus lobatus TaxID=904363 RepID=A0AAW1RB82_9CHLO